MVKYELESLDDFMKKLKDFKIDEVGMKVQIKAVDIPVKRLVPGKTPEEAPTEQLLSVKQAEATLYLTAVGIKKELADSFEIPIVYSEQLESGTLLPTQTEVDAFSKRIEEAKAMAVNALQESYGKAILLGLILPTQHSNYREGNVK